MQICVIGTGYVGLTTGPCLAVLGHSVVCTDSDKGKIERLQRGEMPIYEAHLEDVIAEQRKAGRLEFTADIPAAIAGAEAIFVCVGTPPDADGKANLAAVEAVTRQVAACVQRDVLMIGKSTVPVQTADRMQRTLDRLGAGGRRVTVVSNPEFLREGTGVNDCLHPGRIVVGSESAQGLETALEIYRPLLEGAFACPVHGRTGRECRRRAPAWLVTDPRSAELIKHASNSFLSMKISYANAIAELCERAGANADDVLRGLGMDERIGKAFLRPGIGFGGFCFPKDLNAFIGMAEELGMDFRLLREVERINAMQPIRFLRRIREELWVLAGKRIGVLGLAFKPGTDDIRLSPALAVVRDLARQGARLRVWDPQAMERVHAELGDAVECCTHGEAVAEGAEAVLILTEWPEFHDLDWAGMAARMQRALVMDGRNLFRPGEMTRMGWEYVSVGRAPVRPTIAAGVSAAG